MDFTDKNTHFTIKSKICFFGFIIYTELDRHKTCIFYYIAKTQLTET